jgi:hypothetical protein
MLRCDAVNEALRKSISLVAECDTISDGILRIATEFRYPDGSHVDVFLDQSSSPYILSDLGETAAYLREVGIKPWASRKRRNIVADVCRRLRINQNDGQLQIEFPGMDQDAFADAVLRLGQACIRISDLSLAVRHRSPSDFKDQVQDFIDSHQFQYEVDHKLLGSKGNEVRIDFKIDGPRPHSASLVQTLSAADSNTARHQAEDAFARWYDINEQRNGNSFLTVYDSSSDAFREPDLRRLQDFSQLIRFPAQQQLFLEALRSQNPGA